MSTVETSVVTLTPLGFGKRVTAWLGAVEVLLQWLGGAILAVIFVLVMT